MIPLLPELRGSHPLASTVSRTTGEAHYGLASNAQDAITFQFGTRNYKEDYL